MTSQKCQVCNNMTTDPSGYCHLHQNVASLVDQSAPKVSTVPNMADSSADIYRTKTTDSIWEFQETELGGQFGEDFVILEDNESFTMTVEESFTHNNTRYEAGDNVLFQAGGEPGGYMRNMGKADTEHAERFSRLISDFHNVEQWAKDPSALKGYDDAVNSNARAEVAEKPMPEVPEFVRDAASDIHNDYGWVADRDAGTEEEAARIFRGYAQEAIERGEIQWEQVEQTAEYAARLWQDNR